MNEKKETAASGSRGSSHVDGKALSEAEEQILQAVRRVQFGSVEVVIHDSRVVHVERREKIRVNRTQQFNRKEKRDEFAC